MTQYVPSPDTQAVLLLCGVFDREPNAAVKPLSPSEFARVAELLDLSGMRPADVLQREGSDWLAKRDCCGLDISRITILLQRGASLGFAVDDWSGKGIWVLSRYDDAYPARLKERLGTSAPPLLYGAGEVGLLSAGGLAVVGSRDADEEALCFTSLLAEKCAGEGIQVMSGGAKGVDSAATAAALEAGGQATALLADTLAKSAVAGKHRKALQERRIALASPYYPYAPFNVGNAMGRNKLIYALADWAVVVSSAAEKGGTWAGAEEDLRHKWAPLFVRSGDRVPAGNRLLISRGATGIDDTILASRIALRQVFDQDPATGGDYAQCKLF